MDQTNILVSSVSPLDLPKLEVVTNEGIKYTTDLSDFKKVHCFPSSQQKWEKVSISAGGHNITWACRFEIHVHQAIDHSLKSEEIKLRA